MRLNYACWGAPTGHASAQEPQSMQVSASITYTPSPSEIASTGHSAAHAPQPMQSSVILNAMVIVPPFNNWCIHFITKPYLFQQVLQKKVNKFNEFFWII
jgi:hypothetical protein